MKICKKELPLVALISALGLTACGSDTTNESLEAANRTVGVVQAVNSNGTSVSSLKVSGITFDVSNVSGVEGDEIDQLNQLELGMVVSVSGPVNESNDTGVADEVSYDAKIEGTVDSVFNNGELGVMGQTIVVTDTTVFKTDVDGITLDTIPLGAVVEVSGFMNDQGNIVATRIEVEYEQMSVDKELEVEGFVSNLTMFTETEGTFDIGGYTVIVDNYTMYDDVPNNVLTDGMFVEVKLRMNEENTIVAVKIEAEYNDDMDGFDDDSSDIKLVGTVTSDGVVDGKFELDGLSIILGDNVEYDDGRMEDIVKGAVLEIEAYLNADEMLVATEVEFEEEHEEEYEDDIKLKGTVTSDGVVDGRFELDGKYILLGENVEYDYGNMDDIVSGVMLEVEAYLNADEMLVATEIEFKNVDEVKLVGKVTSEGVIDGKFELDGETIMLGDYVEYDDGYMEDIVFGAMLEVEAYLNTDQMLIASEIEFIEIGDEFDMYGMVTSEGVVDGKFELDGKSIMLDENVKYKYGDMSRIVNGAKLEVEVYLNADYMLVATEIEFEKKDEVKLVGKVTSEGVIDGKFELDGETIMLGDYVEYDDGYMEDIVFGAMLEVEAYLNADQILVAFEIDFIEVGDKFDMYGMVTSEGVVDGKFELDGKSIMLDENVEYKYGDMNDIVNGAKLDVEVYLNADYMLVAVEVKFEKPIPGTDVTPAPVM
ncbi:MAG: hypothetical protein GXP08_13550 [Gammaproteobacteria bacterium]|nr:hypothetical protein [Gammaproteobacteria bacterium]